MFFPKFFYFYNARYLSNRRVKIETHRVREKLVSWQKLISEINLSNEGHLRWSEQNSSWAGPKKPIEAGPVNFQL
jgi:hypothetical protein